MTSHTIWLVNIMLNSHKQNWRITTVDFNKDLKNYLVIAFGTCRYTNNFQITNNSKTILTCFLTDQGWVQCKSFLWIVPPKFRSLPSSMVIKINSPNTVIPTLFQISAFVPWYIHGVTNCIYHARKQNTIEAHRVAS